MPEAQADIVLPEYRVTLGAEFYVTAKSPREAHDIAMDEIMDNLRETNGIWAPAFDRMFTAVTIEKMDDDEEEDDEDGDEDAPEDMPRKPKKPARMRK